ncbi:MAG: type I DNA topoisomerase [Bdellovibrionales bacterium]|nr:type I DNA topoisomerase [Bdellovibrionales bacterium]
MSDKVLVIVESPTKAKTIKKFLPKNFIVMASIGHVRDLPQSASQIPAKYKGVEWAKLGVNVENNFEPLYTIPKGKSKVINELKAELKKCSALYLATDEDREGESISWHLLELLKPKVPVKRMVFHEITKAAITDALEHTRDIDFQLVSSQETRRILDRLVGYTLSPLIWKKIAYGLSAGRVQSAGLRMLVERERERIAFVKAEYWDLKALLSKDKTDFEAKLIQVDNQKIASGKDFEPTTGQLKKEDQVVVLSEKDAKELLAEVKKGPWKVESVEEKDFTSKPYPPFITSTLQQEASRKLGFTARVTMRTAQALYEQGLITYMRTDSPNLSQQAIDATRTQVSELYGKEFLSQAPRQFSSKSKGAQEAHEAIRPAGTEFKKPDETGLIDREFKLYDLIWKRTLASQMAEAQKRSMQVRIASGRALFAASGLKIVFPGYLRVYVEGKDAPEDALEDTETLLPHLEPKNEVDCKKLEEVSHETKPVARYTEASLIQALEKSGIGRPSTYASIISTILDRDYAFKQGSALVPTYTGFVVVQLLENHFEELVDYSFTSKMEETLDEIANGNQESIPYLTQFYLGAKGLQKQVEKKEEKIDPEEAREVKLSRAYNDVQLRVGRFGPFLIKKMPKGEEDIRASIPNDIAPSELTNEKVQEIIEVSQKGPQPIGKHPETGDNIYALLGRFGPYVQLGEMTDDKPKPKRASIPKEISPTEITLDQAVQLLILPRELGPDPKTGNMVKANKGRFGPYVQLEGEFRSIKEPDDVYTIELDRALELLAEPKVSRRGSQKIKELGEHPTSKKKIDLMNGKYGPFLKMGTKNFGLDKEIDLDKLTLEEAVKIINSKE